jgi:flagellar hook-associated protein 3 FlgL
MLSGINAFNGSFLADLNQTEARITQDQKQISSGVRVSQASDDPAAVSSIVNYQQEISRVTQVQKNMNTASSTASAADSALQSASSLLDQLVSIGAQGSSATTSAATQASLASRVQEIAQQFVSLANTSSDGKYIFGGDSATTQPYTFDWTQPKGVVQNSTAGSTGVLTDAGGNQIVAGMTAQQIFDAQNPDGTSATGNVFQAVYDLGTALALPNNQAAIVTATQEIKDAVTHIGQVTTTYGNTENWIQSATADASDRLVGLQQGLSAVRDTDVAAVAVQLTTDNAALQASMSAHATLSNKSLFSFLG